VSHPRIVDILLAQFASQPRLAAKIEQNDKIICRCFPSQSTCRFGYQTEQKSTSPVTALLIRLSRVASCLTVRHFLYIVYLMSNRDYLGEFEHIVVLALLRLGDRAYGVTVRQEIEARTSREVSIGAIYATLDRLEAKGYVKSRLGDPTPERGGRSKRFFRVSAKGVKAVNRTHRALQSMTSGLDLVRSYS